MKSNEETDIKIAKLARELAAAIHDDATAIGILAEYGEDASSRLKRLLKYIRSSEPQRR